MDDRKFRAEEVAALRVETLVPCHVDISGEYADADDPLGLSALADLSDVKSIPGCSTMPAIHFPRASAEKIVEKSNDPMIGDEALAWDGDAIVDEYDESVEPVSIEGTVYWRVGQDFLWEATEGPRELFDLLPDGREGTDLIALADAARTSADMAGAGRQERPCDIDL